MWSFVLDFLFDFRLDSSLDFPDFDRLLELLDFDLDFFFPFFRLVFDRDLDFFDFVLDPSCIDAIVCCVAAAHGVTSSSMW